MRHVLLRLVVPVSACCLLLAAGALALGRGLHSELLAFVSERDGNLEIYAADVARRLLVNISQSPGVDDAPAWSADGTALLYTSRRLNIVQVLLLPLHGGTAQIAPQDAAYARFAKLGVLPESGRQAFEYGGAPHRDVLVRVTCDQLVNVSVSVGDSHNAALAPDGSRVAFVAREQDEADIFVASLLDFPAPTVAPSCPPLPLNFARFAPTLETSPDIDRMIVPNTRAAVNVTRHAGYDDLPVWSPDGAWLAFVSHRDGNMEVYVLDLSSGAQWNISRHTHRDYAPAWAP